jgi:hypothetical protein
MCVEEAWRPTAGESIKYTDKKEEEAKKENERKKRKRIIYGIKEIRKHRKN